MVMVLVFLCLMSSVELSPGHYIHEYYRNQEGSQYYGGDRSARSAIPSSASSLGPLSVVTLTVMFLSLP